MGERTSYAGYRASNPLCYSCFYRNEQINCCAYIIITKKRRPCSAVNCSVYIPRIEQENDNIDSERD